jgi:hypothetical protein
MRFAGESLQIIDGHSVEATAIIRPARKPEGFLGESAMRRSAKPLSVVYLLSLCIKHCIKCRSPPAEIGQGRVEKGCLHAVAILR